MNKIELKKTINEYYQNTNDNIVGVGYGYKTINGQITDEKSIIFTVKEKKSISELKEDELLPKEINISNEKITTDVVQGKFKLIFDIDFYKWIPDNCEGIETVICDNVPYDSKIKPSNRNSFRPLKSGVSISNYTNLSNFVGTLGFFAKDNETNSLVGVTNNHVVVPNAFICSERNISGIKENVKGDTISQPNENVYDNYPIGI